MQFSKRQSEEPLHPHNVARNKIKLLQIKQSCCKFKIVAANELLQIKRMLLQIKTSKVCAH